MSDKFKNKIGLSFSLPEERIFHVFYITFVQVSSDILYGELLKAVLKLENIQQHKSTAVLCNTATTK